MGNIQTQASLNKLNERIQKHMVLMNKSGLSSKEEPVTTQLSETFTYYSDVGKFFLTEKIFIKTPNEPEYSRHIKNLQTIEDSLNTTQYPYFIVPKFNQIDDLPILSRQSLHMNLEDKLLSGINLSLHEKAFIAT